MRRLYTWAAPDGQHWKQINYILCSQRWRSSVLSAKRRPGADCGSDHELLIAKFRLKLKIVGKTTRPFRYDLNQISYKSISKKNKCKKEKWLFEEALQIAEKRREAKGKGEKERYTYLNAEFQRIARRDKKAFLSVQCKEIEETIEWERPEISSRKFEIPREHFMQRWAQ